eukprot:806426-Pelagomonas_calceolata.AAC.4
MANVARHASSHMLGAFTYRKFPFYRSPLHSSPLHMALHWLAMALDGLSTATSSLSCHVVM